VENFLKIGGLNFTLKFHTFSLKFQGKSLASMTRFERKGLSGMIYGSKVVFPAHFWHPAKWQEADPTIRPA
jgi:hypothetical protein